jgi:hypothetical protein
MGRYAIGVLNGNWRDGIYNNWDAEIEKDEAMLNKKKLRLAYWTQRCTNAMDWMRTVDAEGWERWYDDDNHVPADASPRMIAQLVEKRVRELTGSFPIIKASVWRDIFIWQDLLGIFVYSKEVGKDTLYVLEFDSKEMAQAFINGLPISNLGYGYILDILPASALNKVSVDT